MPKLIFSDAGCVSPSLSDSKAVKNYLPTGLGGLKEIRQAGTIILGIKEWP